MSDTRHVSPPDPYAQIARFYDLTHAALIQDLPLLQKLADEAGGTVLELGCGTGRVALSLAQAGHTVTGIDRSAAMLALAHARLATLPESVGTRVAFLEGDMSALGDVLADGHFPLILLPYNTAMHLPSQTLRRTLQAIASVLARNGRVFIDVINPYVLEVLPEERLLSVENVLTDPETDATIMQLSSSWPDESEQIVHTLWLYDVMPLGGGAVQRTAVEMASHYYFPHEWEMWLRAAGLQLSNLWGDYDRAQFDEDSPRLLLLAKSAS